MGNTVNSAHCNDELVDNLLESGYIRSKQVEQVFRAVDRADYIPPSHRKSAYKNIAWKHGHIHLSAPCIYSEVMESLALEPGMSFLNLGSGTGYFSTMAGLILNQHGTNHGIEVYEDCLKYSYERLGEFKQKSLALDKFDFCEPYFVHGNCLNAIPGRQYDRVYCGAACPESHETFIKRFVKVGGILVMPYKDYLLRIKRVDENSWVTETTLPVSFAGLVMPPTKESAADFHLPDCEPFSLQELCRGRIRQRLRQNVWREHAEVEVRKSLPRPILSRDLSPQQRNLIHIEDNPSSEEGESEDEDAGEDNDRDRNIIQDDSDFLFARGVRRVLFNVDPMGSDAEEKTSPSIQFVRAVIQPDLDDQVSSHPQQQQQPPPPAQQQQEQQRVADAENDPILNYLNAPTSSSSSSSSSNNNNNNSSSSSSSTSSSSSSSNNRGSLGFLGPQFSTAQEWIEEQPQPQPQAQQRQRQRQRRGEHTTERWSISSSDSEDDNDEQRKKAPKRDASSDLSSDSDSDELEEKPMETDDVHRRRNSRKKRTGGRVQPPVAHYTDMSVFSGYMKAKIQDLPLPDSLKLYVNYNRTL